MRELQFQEKPIYRVFRLFLRSAPAETLYVGYTRLPLDVRTQMFWIQAPYFEVGSQFFPSLSVPMTEHDLEEFDCEVLSEHEDQAGAKSAMYYLGYR